MIKFSSILFLICIFACCSSPEKKKGDFIKGDVSFTCPPGWSITEEEAIDSSGYYLSVEKDGTNSSALLTISWVFGELELEDFMSVMQGEMNNNIIYEHANLKFSDVFDTTFAGQKAIATKFECSILGLKEVGMIYCLRGKNKCIAILRQEAVDDQEANKAGFEMIESSFKGGE